MLHSQNTKQLKPKHVYTENKNFFSFCLPSYMYTPEWFGSQIFYECFWHACHVSRILMIHVTLVLTNHRETEMVNGIILIIILGIILVSTANFRRILLLSKKIYIGSLVFYLIVDAPKSESNKVFTIWRWKSKLIVKPYSENGDVLFHKSWWIITLLPSNKSNLHLWT